MYKTHKIKSFWGGISKVHWRLGPWTIFSWVDRIKAVLFFDAIFSKSNHTLCIQDKLMSNGLLFMFLFHNFRMIFLIKKYLSEMSEFTENLDQARKKVREMFGFEKKKYSILNLVRVRFLIKWINMMEKSLLFTCEDDYHPPNLWHIFPRIRGHDLLHLLEHAST